MSNIVTLKRQRQAIIAEGGALLQRIESESRSPSADEVSKLGELKTQAEELRCRIERLEEWEGLTSETRGAGDPTKPDPTEERGVTWAEAPKPPEVVKREMEFKFGQFLQAVIRSSRPGSSVDPLLVEQRAALGANETVGSDGGFLVGTDFSAELYRRAYTMGEITSRCRRVPISANANSIKLNGVDETSRATGSRWGGIRGYWLAEAGDLTKSKPKFSVISLNLHKLGVLAYATDELLMDAGALGSILMEAASEEINWMTEDSLINGTGAGMPLGVLNAACVVSVAKEAGQAATSLVYKNLTKMWSRRYLRSAGNMVWHVNQDVEPALDELTMPVGTGGLPANYITYGQDGVQRIKGQPVVPVEYCETLGTTGDILLADWGSYLLAEKGGIQSASSIHVQFTTDETVFRFIYRVDGQPMWSSALIPANGSNTVSPFVKLDTRA